MCLVQIVLFHVWIFHPKAQRDFVELYRLAARLRSAYKRKLTMQSWRCFIQLLILLMIMTSSTWPAAGGEPELRSALIPAFPGAEGAGSMTVGGRAGKVFVVQNLADSGPGSLREAVEFAGPRTIVFGVAGVIQLKTPLEISHPYITIAGQTAPGDGVCVRGETTAINTHDVVIRYMRFRRGNLRRRDDSLGGNPIGNVIIDHVSASWGLDENLSLYRRMTARAEGADLKGPVRNLTIQWCISSEALDLNNHAFGGTWGGQNCSFHHNLFACNTGRNPSIGMGGTFDFRNNVIFNWRHRTMDGGDGSSQVNVVANYYKAGPGTPDGPIRYRICRAQARNARDQFPGFGKWYVESNYVHGSPEITANNWAGGVQYDEESRVKDEIIPAGTEQAVRVFTEFPVAIPVSTEAAEVAYASVLAIGGATLPKRDAVDLRVIESVRTGKTMTETGFLETPADVGGWPAYQASSIPVDSDRDGMHDEWEIQYGLNATSAGDAVLDQDQDGYSNIEEFLNGTDPRQFKNYRDVKNNISSLISRDAK